HIFVHLALHASRALPLNPHRGHVSGQDRRDRNHGPDHRPTSARLHAQTVGGHTGDGSVVSILSLPVVLPLEGNYNLLLFREKIWSPILPYHRSYRSHRSSRRNQRPSLKGSASSMFFSRPAGHLPTSGGTPVGGCHS